MNESKLYLLVIRWAKIHIFFGVPQNSSTLTYGCHEMKRLKIVERFIVYKALSLPWSHLSLRINLLISLLLIYKWRNPDSGRVRDLSNASQLISKYQSWEQNPHFPVHCSLYYTNPCSFLDIELGGIFFSPCAGITRSTRPNMESSTYGKVLLGNKK